MSESFAWAPVGLAYVDCSGRFIRANRRLCAVLGRTEQELLGTAFQDITHPDDLAPDLEQMGQLLSGEIDSYSLDKRYLRADGSIVDARLTGTLVRDADGGPVHFVAIVEPRVPERERAFLRERAAGLDAIHRDSPVGLATFDLDLRCVRANPCFASLAGQPVDAHVGRTMGEIDPAMGPLVDAALADVLVSGRARHAVEIAGDSPERPGVRRVWRASFAPLRSGGEPVGVNAVIEDVTDERRAAISLAESTARLKTMADGVPVAIWVTDREGRVEFVNREYREFFGVTLAQVRDGGWRPILHDEDADAYARAYFDALAARAPFRARTRVRSADGSWRWVESRGLPRFDPDGAFAGHVGTSPDVTAMIESERALRAADARKDEFLAMLAHELRNPLGPIVNAHRVLARDARLGDASTAALALAQRQTTQLARLVDDLLEVSRITRGRIELRRERLPLAALIRGAADAIGPDLQRRGHRLEVSLPAPDVALDADPVRVTQMLGNLLGNACKFTPNGGRIAISGVDLGDAVEIEVTDSGVGFRPDDAQRLFDLFSQVDTTLDRSQGGLGIGLALVKRLAELHGGTVRARSDGLGCGAAFVLRLPSAGTRDRVRSPIEERFVQRLVDPRLQGLYDAWCAAPRPAGEGAVPDVAAVDLDGRAGLENLFVAEVGTQAPLAVRYLRVGRALTDLLGRPLEGDSVPMGGAMHEAADLATTYARCIESRRPQHDYVRDGGALDDPQGPPFVFRRLLLPCARDGSTISHVLGMVLLPGTAPG